MILSNVFDIAVGGIWALYLTGTNFSISAAVGFVSLFGVAIMDGLLMISYFNTSAQGAARQRSDHEGGGDAGAAGDDDGLTAILGLLPAAFSTAIGAQTQRPLAIVVVGGMLTTLFLTRYLMPCCTASTATASRPRMPPIWLIKDRPARQRYSRYSGVFLAGLGVWTNFRRT